MTGIRCGWFANFEIMIGGFAIVTFDAVAFALLLDAGVFTVVVGTLRTIVTGTGLFAVVFGTFLTIVTGVGLLAVVFGTFLTIVAGCISLMTGLLGLPLTTAFGAAGRGLRSVSPISLLTGWPFAALPIEYTDLIFSGGIVC